MEKLLTVIHGFPGFYYSPLSFENIYNYDFYEKENSIPENWFDIYDFESYEADVGRSYLKVLQDYSEIGLNLEFESITNPKFYNYSTDRLFAYMQKDVLNQLREYAEKNINKFEEYLHLAHDSRVGFIPHYDCHIISNWFRETNLDHNEIGDFLLFSLINFNENHTIHHDIIQDTVDYVMCNTTIFTYLPSEIEK